MTDTSKDNPAIPDDDELQGATERSIPQVGSPKRGNNVLVVGFLVCMTGLLLWFVNSGNDAPAPELTDATSDEFRLETRPAAPALPEQVTPVPQQVTTPANGVPLQQQPQTDPFFVEQQRRLAAIALQEAQDARRLAEQRRRSPILIYDESSRNNSADLPNPAGATTATSLFPTASANTEGLSRSESFAARVSSEDVETVTASTLQNQHAMIAQGSLIRGVLETAIQSDLPGFIRAQVSHEVYSFDGSTRLIPKGSRLIGRYQSGLVEGQTRVFVVWSRLLRTDGVSIQIGSPGTDTLGRAGLGGFLDTHFIKRFGSSALLSIVGGATASIGNNSSGSDRVIQGTADSFNRSAEIALENSINIPPTIFVDQGEPIQVFVAKDLDFSGVQ